MTKFKLSKIEYNSIQKEKLYYENSQAVIITALKIIQKYRGWVSDDAIIAISDILDISTTEIESIATFYNQIFRLPVGKNIIRYCDSIVCYIVSKNNIEILLQKILDIKPGETTLNNKFTLLPTCCLGKCDKSPVIMINDIYFTNVKTTSLKNILDKFS